MNTSDLVPTKRRRIDHLLNSPTSPHIHTPYIYIQTLGLPLISSSTGSPSDSIRLEPNRPHTIGRTRRLCDSAFEDTRVSKTHCQILFDSVNRKLLLSDGVFWFGRVRVSLNGVFVNGVRIWDEGFVELRTGDEVALVCSNGQGCDLGFRIGFIVRKIVCVEEVTGGKIYSFGANRVPSSCCDGRSQGYRDVKLDLLLGLCRRILDSNDPVFCIRKCINLHNGSDSVSGKVKILLEGARELENGTLKAGKVGSSLIICRREKPLISESENDALCVDVGNDHSTGFEHADPIANNVIVESIEALNRDSVDKENAFKLCRGVNDVNRAVSIQPPGCKFFLNRLQSMGVGSSGHDDVVVSLPELLSPVESLQRIFIATFTSDIRWFLSYCEIPVHIPVTIACHNRDRCWSSRPEERISMPYSDFPHLVVVYPPFPEAIAFGNDRKKLGIACHHPKLIVLQRQDSIRVVITSANLVSKQWNDVTNTVWWQDFPRASRPDYLSLFTQISGDVNQDLQSDFAAQLAGFMASLTADVPNQAHWIIELTKYDFKIAVGHLVASVPGIHSRRVSSIFESMYFSFQSKQCSQGTDIVKTLGSIETCVVGLSHLFCSSADSNGTQLKKLASFIQNCYNPNGMLEVVLKRNKHNPADVNAVSVLVPNPEKFLVEDCVQIGFLPRHVAKWVAPLLDGGLFRFSGFVYPKEVIATALDGSASKVHMLLYVSQWGCWSASQELINPSVRIIFPTIERVKSASCGILASKHLLCFSQKTWDRLRDVGILHDAIPYPYDRVNHPMHGKVARRRFRSKTDASSFGWVYCGSHNFSAAAWGRPLSNSNRTVGDRAVKTNSILGSKLHICNYELGIIFVVPPSDTKTMNLDDIVLPFVVPAPKYRPCDRPATPQAMKEAYRELRWQERESLTEELVGEECIEEEMPDEEEEILESSNYVVEEQADEKAYAEALWSQVDSSQSC